MGALKAYSVPAILPPLRDPVQQPTGARDGGVTLPRENLVFLSRDGATSSIGLSIVLRSSIPSNAHATAQQVKGSGFAGAGSATVTGLLTTDTITASGDTPTCSVDGTLTFPGTDCWDVYVHRGDALWAYWPGINVGQTVEYDASGNGHHLTALTTTTITERLDGTGTNWTNDNGYTESDDAQIVPAKADNTTSLSEKYAVTLPTPDRFVSKTGSDSANGLSEETAWLTITHAIATSPGGAVIQIGEGVYDEAYSTTYGYLINKALDFVGSGDVTVKSSSVPTYLLYTQSAGFGFYNLTFDVLPGQHGFYTNSTGNCIFYNCTINADQNSGKNVWRLRSSCTTYRIILCDINIENLYDLSAAIKEAVLGIDVPLEISGCTIDIQSIGESSAFVVGPEATTGFSFLDNTIAVEDTSGAGAYTKIISAANKSNITVTGNSFTSLSSGVCSFFVNITDGVTSFTTTISKNIIQYGGLSGYIFGLGDETLPTNPNTINVAVEDNTIYGAKYFDTSASTTTHAIFCGYISDSVIQRNRIHGCGYGVILKGNAGSDHSGGQCFSNLLIENTIGIYIKGANGALLYNNTLVGCGISANSNDGANDPTGIVIKNNTASFDGPFLSIETITDLASDYNIVDCTYFAVGGLTLAQWQSANSLDLNSSTSENLYNSVYSTADTSALRSTGVAITLSVTTLVDIFGRLLDLTAPNVGCSVNGPVTTTDSPALTDGLGGELQNAGPLRRDMAITIGTTYPNITVTAPLGPKFQAITEWTNNAAVDLSTFVDTTKSRFGDRGGVVYEAEQDTATIARIDRVIGNS